MIAAENLVALLRVHRFPVSTEQALQVAIGQLLTIARIDFEAEVRLSPGERIDFLTKTGVGIEAKTRYPRRRIYRQLERYSRHDAIKALILVTGTAIGLPATIREKPVYLVSLGRAAL